MSARGQLTSRRLRLPGPPAWLQGGLSCRGRLDSVPWCGHTTPASSPHRLATLRGLPRPGSWESHHGEHGPCFGSWGSMPRSGKGLETPEVVALGLGNRREGRRSPSGAGCRRACFSENEAVTRLRKGCRHHWPPGDIRLRGAQQVTSPRGHLPRLPTSRFSRRGVACATGRLNWEPESPEAL